MRTLLTFEIFVHARIYGKDSPELSQRPLVELTTMALMLKPWVKAINESGC